MCGEIGRELDMIGDDEVAIGAVAPVVALAAQTNLGVVLRFGLDFQLDFTVITKLKNHLTTQQCGIEIDVDLEVHLAVVHTTASLPGCASATHVAKQILKEAGEHAVSATCIREIEALKGRTGACSLIGAPALPRLAESIRLPPVLPKLVVFLSFLRVANDIVCLVECLKLGFRLGVVRVQVGMELLGTLAVRLAHIFLWDVCIHSQYLVIVYKCHNLSSL